MTLCRWLAPFLGLVVAGSALAADYRIDILLAEEKAYLVDASKADALENDRSFTRQWRGIPNQWLEDIAAEVRARRTETNPKADLRVYAGTWRISQVQILRGKEGDGQLFEILNFGLATTLGTDEPRLGAHQGDPWVSGFRMQQVWPYVDPQAVDTLFTNLVTITNVVNPVADSQTYSGTFVASECSSKRLEDAAIEVSRWLTRVSSPADGTALALLPYRTIQKNEILRLFTLETGEGDLYGIVFDYLNPSDTVRNALFAIADATLVSSFAAGWTYSDRDWKVNKDNTATFTILFKKATWLNTAGTGASKTLLTTNIYSWRNYNPRTDVRGLQVQRIDGADAVPSGDAAAILAYSSTNAGYVIDDLDMRDLGDGSVSIRRAMTYHRATTNQYITEFQPAWANTPEQMVVTWHLLPDTDATLIYNDATSHVAAMSSAVYAPAPASHKLRHISKEPIANGLLTVRRTTWIPSSGGTAWPESTATYTNMYWDYHYKSIGTGLHRSQNRVCRWEKFEGTLDAAENDVSGWRTTSMFGDSNGMGLYLDEDRTKVYSMGGDRYKAQAVWVSTNSPYLKISD